MNKKDILISFIAGYLFTLGGFLIIILIRSFIFWDISINDFDLLWKSYSAVRFCLIGGLGGILFKFFVDMDATSGGNE